MKEAKESVLKQLKKELAIWQTKMDEAKVQMHLGVKEVEDKIKPHVELFDQELNEAKNKLEELGKSSEGAWAEVQEGIESSLDVMKTAFERAQKHFTKDK